MASRFPPLPSSSSSSTMAQRLFPADTTQPSPLHFTTWRCFHGQLVFPGHSLASTSELRKTKMKKKKSPIALLVENTRGLAFREIEHTKIMAHGSTTGDKRHALLAVTNQSSGSQTGESGDDDDGAEHEEDGESSGGTPAITRGIGAYASRALAVGEAMPPEGFIVLMSCAVGLMTGVCVVLFNVGVHELHDTVWQGIPSSGASWIRAQPLERHWIQVLSVPSAGGIVVGVLNMIRDRWGEVDGDTLQLSVKGKEPRISMMALWSDVKASLRPVIKTLAAMVTLATGNALGPEGPSVEVGASIANGLGTILKSSRERKLSFIAAGSAAGISSGFNAPISGCFFAVESVLRPSSADSAPSLTTAMVLLSSVLASVVSQAGLGSDPAFKIPAYDFRSPAELPLYLTLGILCGLVSVGLTKCSSFSTTTIQKIKKVTGMPSALLPPLGGLCVGVIALAYPEVLYWGFENVDILLESRPFQKGLPANLLLQLVAAKIVATSICRGSGLVGGVYAPSLFIGAALGAAYGKLAGYAVAHADPMYHLDALKVAAPQAYALVGMAAMLAGICQVPLTSVLLLFELTRDYRIIIPLMAAVGLSSWVASAAARKQPKATKETVSAKHETSFGSLTLTAEQSQASELVKPFTFKSESETITSQRTKSAETSPTDNELCMLDNSLCVASRDLDEDRLISEITVASAMRTCFTAVAPHTRVHEVLDMMLRKKEWCVLLVRDSFVLEGIVTFSDIQQCAEKLTEDTKQKVGLLKISTMCNSWDAKDTGFPLVTAFPDTDLRAAQRLMARRGLRQLPVISRERYTTEKIKYIVGLLDRECIQLACRAEATKRLLGMSTLPVNKPHDGANAAEVCV